MRQYLAQLGHLPFATYLALAGLVYIAYRVYRFQTGTNAITRGSASWLSVIHAEKGGMFRQQGLLIGDFRRWLLLPSYYNGDSNALVVGPPGSNKGAGFLITNALLADFLVLIDPGGETSAVCAAEWRRKGYTVSITNPWGLFPDRLGSAGFDPLAAVDPQSMTFESDVMQIGKLAMNEAMASVGEHAYFTIDAATGIGILALHSVLIGDPSLLHVRRLIRADAALMSKTLVAMAESDSHLVREKAAEWKWTFEKDPKTFSQVFKTMTVATDWMDNELIARSLMSAPGRMEDLKGYDADRKPLRGVVFGLVMPVDALKDNAPYARLYAASVMRTMMRGGNNRRRVLMLVDEFPALGKFEFVVTALNTCRKYKLWIALAVQSIGQLNGIYGNDGAAVIEAGCGLQICLGGDDPATKKYFSDACGKATIAEKGPDQDGSGDPRTAYVSRPLIMPEEVGLLGKRRQLVLQRKMKPALMASRPYWERPQLAGRFSSNPYYGDRKKGLFIAWPAQVLAGLVVRGFCGIGPYAVLLAVAGYLIWRTWR